MNFQTRNYLRIKGILLEFDINLIHNHTFSGQLANSPVSSSLWPLN